MSKSLNEIKRASTEQLAMERANSKNVSETSPSQITEEILDLVESLGSTPPIFVPVIEDTHGLYGWCSDGVREKIKSDGGKPVFGWTIWEWPSFLITAEFHCIWQSDASELYDITPKPKGESTILFAPDPTCSEDFDPT
ncbi:hypothetical protein [Sphingobium sp. KCTC 72723]|uniref:hypothetical protein n=1 Tax=Sphingobium sp. KCTC 72723 TaxID=2733867 RepID=UPI00165E31E4|nr:hypothetical protein [Sphingobium sp. KCTC 72723]